MKPGYEIFLEEPASPDNAKQLIEEQINSNDVMLYMKGSPLMPQCGFSARVVQILNLIGTPYTTFNVLSDMVMREAVKEHGQWPTIPQVYHKGELLGGCDILTDMYQSGELQKVLREPPTS